MSALINCVELKESADNCAAMADIAVRLPPARAAGEGMFGGDRRKQQQPGLGGGISTPRCLAPEFLAKLLVRCTRSFAHQLKTDRSDGDGEEGGVAASPAPARVQQPGRGTTGYKPARGGAADSSTAQTTAPGVEPAAPATPATPQAGDNAEQSMSHAEGTDLVLGGHCALLLGLLVRGQERNRCGQRRRGFACERNRACATVRRTTPSRHLFLALLCGALVAADIFSLVCPSAITLWSLLSTNIQLPCRRLALPVLPNGDPVLIVRVLEAFMALQFQAGVLTEEIVLAVQGLVEVSVFIFACIKRRFFCF